MPPQRGIQERIAANKLIIQARWFYGLGIFILGLVSRSDQVTNTNFPTWLMAAYLIAFFLYNGGVWMAVRWVETSRKYKYINAVAALQLGIELLFMASVMHSAGGVESVSTTFFFIPIIASIAFFNAVAPLVIALASGGIINILVLLEFYGIVPHIDRYFFSSEFGIHKILSVSLTQTITISIVYLIVGFLVSYIATIIRRREDLLMESNRIRAEQLETTKRLNAELDDTAHKLAAANKRLKKLDEVKSEFVSVAAHQLRTPMTGIRWTFRVLLDEEEGDISESQRDLIGAGLKATVNAINLVNDLLNVARIEEGRLEFDFRREKINPLLADALERIRPEANAKGVTLESSVPTEPILASVDTQRIAMVFDNLLSNAVKYTKPGGTVEFGAESSGKHVRIWVRDTGIGIPKDQQHRIFSKFFRASNAMLFHTSGTGLGLYLVKNIVEHHDGDVSVESTEGEGTTVTVTLPHSGASAAL